MVATEISRSLTNDMSYQIVSINFRNIEFIALMLLKLEAFKVGEGLKLPPPPRLPGLNANADANNSKEHTCQRILRVKTIHILQIL